MIDGPSIKTISKVHSIIQEIPDDKKPEQTDAKPDSKVESIVIFSHRETFKEIFRKQKPKIPQRVRTFFFLFKSKYFVMKYETVGKLFEI